MGHKYIVVGVKQPGDTPGERLLMLSTLEHWTSGKVRVYDERKKEWQHPYFENHQNIVRFNPGWMETDWTEEIEPPASADDRWADHRVPRGRPYP